LASCGWSEPLEANQGTGQQHERKEPSRAPIPPHRQAPIAAQPRQRPLHPPAMPAQPGRGLDPTPSDPCGDPRRRSQARLALLSYPLSASSLLGRLRRRPDGVRTGGMSSTTASSMATSGTLAAVTTAVSGRPFPSQASWILDPGLPRSTGFAPTWSPAFGAHAGRVHAGASSPAGRPDRAGPEPLGGAARTPPRWPTRSTAATPWLGSRSPVPERQQAPRGWKCGPCRRLRRSSCRPEWCGPGRPTRDEAAVAGGAQQSPTGRRGQARLRERSWRWIIHPTLKGAIRRLSHMSRPEQQSPRTSQTLRLAAVRPLPTARWVAASWRRRPGRG
jgi:hypothetical protein